MLATNTVERLLLFAREKGLLAPEDTHFARNALYRALGMEGPGEGYTSAEPAPLPATATELLLRLADVAVSRGLIGADSDSRDRFGAHLMSLVTPPPSQVARTFAALRGEKGIRAATDWYYALSRASDYIRVDQIARNAAFTAPSPYGDLEITINLSKPEKDPRDIAAARTKKSTGYPACMLCLENEGYAGRPDYPSHETLRTVPLTLGGEAWRMQFSPYVYYDEHCIAFNERHIPMAIERRTFALLLDLVDQLPHYFFGSNADLPIVGGSILSHDHFQGGRHVFPMDNAPAYASFVHPGYPDVKIQAVRWPMTCIRIASFEKGQLIALADELQRAWRLWDDPDHDVIHGTDGVPHNTVTPIARVQADASYLVHLVLRNNRTTAEHPLGIFHPHADLHPIKKENIGLIEVMGLFILPGRLRAEMEALTGYLTGDKPLAEPAPDDPAAKHFPWVREMTDANGTALPREAAQRVIRDALGQKCARVLEDAGVFKATPEGDAALARFLGAMGIGRF